MKMYLNYFSSYTIRRDLSRCDRFIYYNMGTKKALSRKDNAF